MIKPENNKYNFSCLIGSELGYLKIFNGYEWTVEKELNLKIGKITQIKKQADEYYLSASNKLFNLKNLTEESLSIYYNPKDHHDKMIGFDFIDSSVVVGYNDSVQIVKDKEFVSQICSGKYEAFKTLRNGHVAVGGQKTEMHIYNVESADKAVFISKGQPDKGLSLPAKVHMTSIEQDIESDNIIYCGTKFNTIQLYDIRSNQRKAQLTANFHPDRSVVQLSSLGPLKVIAGSNGGLLGIVDFKFVHKTPKSGTAHSNYSKFKATQAGTITDIGLVRQVKSTNQKGLTTQVDILLSTAMDGHLSLFDVATREPVKKVHLGKKPACVFVDSVNACKTDDLWDELEEVERDMDKRRKRKDTDGDVEGGNKKLRK